MPMSVNKKETLNYFSYSFINFDSFFIVEEAFSEYLLRITQLISSLYTIYLFFFFFFFSFIYKGENFNSIIKEINSHLYN